MLFRGEQAWYIPKYTAQRYSDLKTATDLLRYLDTFADPDRQDKIRILGCSSSWSCTAEVDERLKSLGIYDSFNVVSPGSPMTADATILSMYRKKKDFVFYNWNPSPLNAEIDLVPLSLVNKDKSVDVNYEGTDVFTGLNAKFSKQAPQLTQFFETMKLEIDTVNEFMNRIKNQKASQKETALWYLENYREQWQSWIPKAVAQRVNRALANQE